VHILDHLPEVSPLLVTACPAVLSAPSIGLIAVYQLGSSITIYSTKIFFRFLTEGRRHRTFGMN